MSTSRRAFLSVAASAALAGCSGLLSSGSDDCSPTGDSVPTASDRLPLPMEPADLKAEARSGGPSKDGIPSIDEPTFVDADAADHVADGEIVFGLERGDRAKAYPQSILVHHEIVNDRITGDPVTVSYCPLTGTAMGFERGETTFGVSGRLINNNLVMYDRGTEAWWPQITATSIPGQCNETPETRSLQEFRVVWTSWEAWRTRHPDTRVLSEDTGFVRDYDNDPYGPDYYTSDSTLFPNLHTDDRFHKKRTVMGVRTPEGAAAFLKDALRERGTMTGQLGDSPIVAVHDPRLDTAYVYRNPGDATLELDGEEATLDGDAYAPDSVPLDRVYTFDAMWFAWIGFYPDSNVYA